MYLSILRVLDITGLEMLSWKKAFRPFMANASILNPRRFSVFRGYEMGTLAMFTHFWPLPEKETFTWIKYCHKVSHRTSYFIVVNSSIKELILILLVWDVVALPKFWFSCKLV